MPQPRVRRTTRTSRSTTRNRGSRSATTPEPPPNGSRRRAAQSKPRANDTTVAIRLAAALDESGLTKSDVARLLAGSGATKAQVEAQRRLLLKWLRNTKPGIASAKRLSEIFGRQSAYFLDVAVADEVADALTFASEAAMKLRPSDKKVDFLTGPLDRDDIIALFPHFDEHHLFIDAVTTIEPGKSAEALRVNDESQLFWRQDIVPGYVLTEALAQTAAIALLALPENRDRVILCAALNGIRFRHIIHAGEHDEVQLLAKIMRISAAIATAEVEARAGDQVAVYGRLMLSIS